MRIYEKQLEEKKPILFKLLSDSQKEIPFYNKVLKDDIMHYLNNYDAWTEIPIVKKETIQNEWTSFVPNVDILTAPGIKVAYTSGSTGEPLKIVRSIKQEIYHTKKLWEARRQWNKDIMNMRLLYLYRNVESEKLKVLRLGEHKDYLDLSEGSMASYIKEIINFRPEWMIGPPIAATRLANYCKEKKLCINSIKLVELFGEMLLPYQRQAIEEAFECRIINHYGAREFGVISYECPDNNMHAWTDDYFIEVIKDGKPVPAGSTGEIVITSLRNRTMPLIRYALGDLVELTLLKDECGCGQHSKYILKPVGGRISNLVITPKKVISSSIFDTLFSRFIVKYTNSIKEFQVVQKSPNSFDVHIVEGNKYAYCNINELLEQLRIHLDYADINIIKTNHIRNEKSGKTPTFIPLSQ